MEYYGTGFSNIRLPNNNNSYIYKYDANINTFPEEVFIHEFLHSLERYCKDRMYNIPQLHDNEKYGYRNENKEGLRKWYLAYLQKTIADSNGNKIGLDSDVYTMQPVHRSNFEYTYPVNALKEPKNIIEEINALIKKISKIIKKEP